MGGACVVEFLEVGKESVIGVGTVGIECSGSNHTVNDEGVVTTLRRLKDQMGILWIELTESGELEILVKPEGVALLRCKVGSTHLLQLADRHQVAVVVVDTALVVGESKLEDTPSGDDAKTGYSKEVDEHIEYSSTNRWLYGLFSLRILH